MAGVLLRRAAGAARTVPSAWRSNVSLLPSSSRFRVLTRSVFPMLEVTSCAHPRDRLPRRWLARQQLSFHLFILARCSFCILATREPGVTLLIASYAVCVYFWMPAAGLVSANGAIGLRIDRSIGCEIHRPETLNTHSATAGRCS